MNPVMLKDFIHGLRALYNRFGNLEVKIEMNGARIDVENGIVVQDSGKHILIIKGIDSHPKR